MSNAGPALNQVSVYLQLSKILAMPAANELQVNMLIVMLLSLGLFISMEEGF